MSWLFPSKNMMSKVSKVILREIFPCLSGLIRLSFFIYEIPFKNNKSVSVTILDNDIVLNHDYADVTANVLLLGANDWLPERGQIYNVASRWKKVKGDWVMSRLRWEKKLN